MKRYVQEAGSAEIDRWFAREFPLMTASLAYAEMYSALTRLQRSGQISRVQLQRAVVAFEEDWRRIHVVALNDDVCRKLPSLFHVHPLRGADAIHLASALLLVERGIAPRFAASDRKLLNAAADAGLATVDPSEV
ncbi:MAG: type II toxin-antitoxin system VapC family toxin [Deltaproteobacteria bacterium]|nr:type II toxin-antitoxin system VapC family toxin [Deltaproteobacteria bacterium]